MTSRSMCDVAFEILASKPGQIPFSELWVMIVEQMGFTPSQAENKIAQFYSALMLDARFAPFEGNVWDLRTRRTYHEVHVDTSKIIIEEEFASVDDDDEYIINEDELDFEKSKKDDED